MGKILVVLALYSCSLFAQEIKQNPDGSISITITKEMADDCKRNGGCTLISMKLIEAIIWESANQLCGKKI